jgi:hypothetical protein
MNEIRISVFDGKYTFIKSDNDWKVVCLRYNEPWMIFGKGHNAISQLLYEHDRLQTENERLKEAVCPLKGQLREAAETAKWTIEKKKYLFKIDLLKDVLRDVCESNEIMEARRFARQALEREDDE